MIDKMNELITEGRGMLLLAFGVVVVALLLITYARTRALVPTLAVGLTGAVGLWMANNYLLVESFVDQDLGIVEIVDDDVIDVDVDDELVVVRHA